MSRQATATQVRVVIADDHTLLREGTSRILETQPDIVVVGEAGDGAGAVEAVLRLQPDVALLDVRMPVLNGIDATQRIREQAPNVAVLVLSAYADDEYVSAVIRAGASGYLLKTVRAHELIEAVRRVGMGEVVLHPAVAGKLARLFVKNTDNAPEEHKLTAREMDILRLVCQGRLNKEIAGELSLSIRTVEGHLNAILGKLGARSRTEAAMFASSKGWFSEGTWTPWAHT
ncbi:MAG: response regulator transcription factor [Dehalococcoidia bacterium]|nr:MAG: response regulator transcription factor [Dehalococcoidia bacterium]